MELKDRIRQLREAKGLSLTKLAVEFDLKEAGVRAWELGRTKPSADTLIKLARYFDCTTDYLLGLSNTKNEKTFEKITGVFSRINVVNTHSKGLLTKIIEVIIDGWDLFVECDTLSDKDIRMNEFYLDMLDDLFEQIKLCYDDVGLIFRGIYHMGVDPDDMLWYKGEVVEYSSMHQARAHNIIGEMLSMIRDKAVEAIEEYTDDRDMPTLEDMRNRINEQINGSDK